GRDEEMERRLTDKMNNLASEMKFEDAEVIRRRLDKIQHARQECKDTFFSIWNFNYIAVLASDSVSKCKIAFIRHGRIVGFEEYQVETLKESLDSDIQRIFAAPAVQDSSEAVYDEFCLVSNFIIDAIRSVELLPIRDLGGLATQVLERLQQRKRKRKPAPVQVQTS